MPADRVDFCPWGSLLGQLREAQQRAAGAAASTPCCRRLHVHHVRVDHLVALQHLLWHRHAVPGEVREAVSGGWLRVHAAHRGDGEMHGQRRVL